MSEPFNQTQAKTRLLLALWDMGEPGLGIKKGDLMRRVVRTGEKSADYQPILDDLGQEGAIAITKAKGATLISLSDRGRQVLAAGLKSTEFAFGGNQVGSRVANALLKWIRQVGEVTTGLDSKPVVAIKAIASYDEFKVLALDTFEKLDRSYNYAGLVPIWHVRQNIGDRASQEQFNTWIMQMQGEQLFYLQSGEARGATEDQKRASITSEVRGLLFFVSQPS
jgi:hypothetical protein